ncbi:FtsX-like permease family protein [Amphibacillus sediminis]|uniref:FtsX-like permease family protein n=1 Tax=Amphibacillus sediminis TaxID=360185 RepID=UPI0008365F47|nr:FtsX-like permease family protein [Amphibacillus sediminis]
MGAKATVKSSINHAFTYPDRELAGEVYQDYKALLDQLIQSPEVKYADYSIYIETFIHTDHLVYRDDSSILNEPERLDILNVFTGVNRADFKELVSNEITIEAGRTFTEQEINLGLPVLLINGSTYEYSNQRSIEVGDVIRFTIEFSDARTNELIHTEPYDLEVVGLFQSGPSINFNFDSASQIDLNLFIPNQTMIQLAERIEEIMMTYDDVTFWNNQLDIFIGVPTFELKNVEAIDSFTEQVNQLLESITLDREHYQLVTSADAYDDIAIPMESLLNTSSIILMGAIGFGIVMISLIVLWFLRDRRFELAVLLALGERKQRLMMQVTIELVVIAWLAVSGSILTGHYIVTHLSENMLETFVNQDQPVLADSDDTDEVVHEAVAQAEQAVINPLALDTDEIIASYQIKFGARFYGVLYSLCLLIILVAVILPMSYLLRLNPRKIML